MILVGRENIRKGVPSFPNPSTTTTTAAPARPWYDYACIPVGMAVDPRKRPSPHLAEVLVGEEPCRFYLDIDDKGPDASVAKVQAVVAVLTDRLEAYNGGELIEYDLDNADWGPCEEAMYQGFLEAGNSDADIKQLHEEGRTHINVDARKLSKPYLFTACRPGKISFHVVYAFKVNGSVAAGRLLKALHLDDNKEFFACVDPAVYSNNRLFRMPWASKITAADSQLVPFEPLEGVGRCLEGINADIDTLLTTGPTGRVFEVPEDTEEKLIKREQMWGDYVPLPKAENLPTGNVAEQDKVHMDKALDQLWNWFLIPIQHAPQLNGYAYKPEFKLQPFSWNREGKAGWMLHPGAPCIGPHRKAPHSNNGSYLMVTKSKKGDRYFVELTCADPQCPNRRQITAPSGRKLDVACSQWRSEVIV